MATTTTNFGWDIPQSTDLVKDGATAIAALGQDIDTAFVDLKGGTTGQVLKKTSATDLDVEWGTASSGLTLINTTSFSAVSSVSLPADTFTSTYDDYLIKIYYTATASPDLLLRMRAAGSDDTNANYNTQNIQFASTSVTSVRFVNQTSSQVGNGRTTADTFEISVYSPKKTEQTRWVFHNADNIGANAAVYTTGAGGMNTNTAYDSGTFSLTTGNFSGRISAYGFSK
jgi:hypothetical protein